MLSGVAGKAIQQAGLVFAQPEAAGILLQRN